MSESVRDKARRLLAGITPGEWAFDVDREAVATDMELELICRMSMEGLDGDARAANCELIAAAPGLVAALLEELDANETLVAEQHAQLAECGYSGLRCALCNAWVEDGFEMVVDETTYCEDCVTE